MQRSICRWVGACGLIVTTVSFNDVQAATAAATGSAAATTSAAAPARTGSATAGASPGAAVTGTPGQSLSALPGQSLSTIPGQSVTATPAAAGGQTVGVAGNPTGVNGNPVGANSTTTGATTGVTPGTGTQIGVNGTAGTQLDSSGPLSGSGATAATTVAAPAQSTALGNIGSRTALSLSSLSSQVQSSIASQLPAGSQLTGVVAENTAAGPVLHAQAMVNGVMTDIPLAGINAAAVLSSGTTAAGVLNGTTPPTATTTGVTPTTAGFEIPTSMAFGDLPVGVQSAFNAQANGQPISNVSYAKGANGGVYNGLVNGQPIQVRVLTNGMVASAPGSTNTLKMDDLPNVAKDAVNKAIASGEVTRINKSTTPGGTVYDVLYKNNDRTSFIQVAEDGTIIRQEQLWPRTLAPKDPEIVTNELPRLAWSSLPVAVRDAVEAKADPKTLRTLVLTNWEGRTAFVVDWIDRDSLRNRIYVGKDGLILNTITNLYGVIPTGNAIIFDNLPIAARSTIEEQANPATITRIDFAMRGLTPVYVVSYHQNGELQQMVVSREGLRMNANATAEENAAGAPAAAIKASADSSTSEK